MAEITIPISDKALKVALAVLGALFLLWGFGLWSSGAFRPTYQIQMFVPEAAGVLEGASVTLDGMPIGKVSRVELADKPSDSNRKIRLVLRIEKQFQNMVRDDSTASLVSSGLLGDRHVGIQRGIAGSPINSGGEIRAIQVKEATLTDFIDAIEKRADCQNKDKSSPGHKPAIGSPTSNLR
jgi:phospholipid/cholesterol/gamma-HCH transport system substrate-binding protein